jgi:hypothetical protein
MEQVALMGTQDDKISNNRRRLAKALSAAPVVATLSPGEALATHSSYQCIAKIREHTHVSTFIDCNGSCADDIDPNEGYAYQQFWFFDPADGSKVPNDTAPRTCPIGSSGIIVHVDVAGGGFFNLSGTDVSDSVLRSGTDSAPTLNIYNLNIGNGEQSDSTLCLTGIPGQKGLFAVVVKPIITGGDEKGAEFVGFYPQTDPNVNPNQLMTGTCWTSITGGQMPPWVLSKG